MIQQVAYPILYNLRLSVSPLLHDETFHGILQKVSQHRDQIIRTIARAGPSRSSYESPRSIIQFEHHAIRIRPEESKEEATKKGSRRANRAA